MKLGLEISAEAEKDLEIIFEYTHNEHGLDKAYECVSSFDLIFEGLVKHPK